MHTKHFVLTLDGGIREFTPEQAAMVAAGTNALPEFADRRVRYLQITFDDESGTELKIQTAGASIRFDAEGTMAEASPPSDQENITRFEHDACVQWALKDIPATAVTFH